MAGMLETASAGLDGGTAAFQFLRRAAAALPFDRGCFELVIANHMLYHVPDARLAVAELRRVLPQGGRLMAATNDGLTVEARRVPAGRVREHIEREGAFVIRSETGVFQAGADAS